MSSAKNELSALGRKIFLDRYALKDVKKETLKVGDVVVAVSNPKTGQREIGVVTELKAADGITVKLDDGMVLHVKREDVDKPLEIEPAQMLARVAKGIASIEKQEVRTKWEAEFNWLLEDWKFVPGGRILTGAGTDQNLTYFNCYVIPSPKDSRGGIIASLGQMTEIMSRGGGVGMNISSLRPRHSYVKGVNGRSSGSVSWGGLFSFVTGLIEQGGSRRGALMLILNVWHPDIIDFINSKREMGKITNANISVGITDDFMEAVRKDADWQTCFPDTSDPAYNAEWDGDIAKWKANGHKVVVYQTQKAKKIWDAIVESAWASAEPGVFFIDRYNKMSNSWYYSTIQSTNPCGEQGLPPWGVCNLGSINLSRFVEGKKVLYEDLGRAVRNAVRFLDNVIDDTPYFFEENKKQQLSERRIGLGTMGLADMLIKMELPYGSDESLAFIDELYKFICIEAYNESSDLAQEKGSFPYFDAEKLLQSGFMLQMPQELREKVRKQGLRNVTLLTQAPTGTTGTMVNTSTGIEPYYFWEWERTGRMGTNIERVKVYDDWVKAHPGQKKPSYFVSAMDLAPEGHVKVQAAIQRWVDSSISKTGNTPKEYTVEQTGKLYELLYDLGCKGGTTYRDGSRDTQVLTAKKEEPKEEKPVVSRSTEPKPRVRSTVLQGTTYRKATPIGTAYITVNCDGPNPSDIFEVFINVAKVGSDVAADAEGLGRLISLILRMPSPLTPDQRAQAIIGQLSGIGSGRSMGFGKNRVMSLPDAVAQVLQQHIGSSDSEREASRLPDEEDEDEDGGQLDLGLPSSTASVKPDICPICGNVSFVNIEGCKKCFSCGHSEC
ncbi:MAG: adenosylcobalamin-dependent ribonucleoside-diphosphate reductase [Sphaerochaeta sp.]|jgi:ribonucleoside-diphosphate reductase alpha chain|uniref:adenosylcobalamin-dependent ribonucleoside-diphosphate reductase n=1 Tax=unclassified Sphaerochaeta TaxID=2637943 RepID=UPI000B2E279C|nr:MULTISPECIES: adenosylcobalamin-dependent ribonucleoside-diphosphate reductase [unclassified Sphaerochaeta]MCK9598561.1 adenosylcobalamin-dependent ribonucleoside-diphosphate reductase [Sphaerochaeta sp.]MDX9824942.1 adenosylcobalamin-dependent ribonucleoside-diphosphate reductase [Sphaerochaeta sp.]HPE93814.1 adenosylcobalamin-dependent ribonucleoside-diphosphate reductase [Sphaerochaeta sp.]